MSEVGKSVAETASEKAELAGDLDVRIAQELIERARAEGVSLVGERGLLQQAIRTVLQTALGVGQPDGDQRADRFAAPLL